MNKIKNLLKARSFWMTAGVVAGVSFGAAGSAIVKSMEAIACLVQTCV